MKKHLLALLILFIGFEASYACICNQALFENKIKNADFIFTGKVISIENVYSEGDSKWPLEKIIKLKVENSFKGNRNDTLIIKNGLSSCSFNFEEEKKYIVFADHLINSKTVIDESFIESNNKIVTSVCSGSREIVSGLSDKRITMLENYFSSNLSTGNISADHLYNKIWENGVFIFTDENPKFPQGVDSLSSFFHKNLKPCTLPVKRPNSDLYNELRGDSLYKEFNMTFKTRAATFAMIHFDVSKTGGLSNFRIDDYFSLNKECDFEALRVSRLMPNWKPATIKGIRVNSTNTIEVDFKSKTAY